MSKELISTMIKMATILDRLEESREYMASSSPTARPWAASIAAIFTSTM